MLFNFRLRDIDEFMEKQNFFQHWFGLTDGWYWIKVGDDELFRFSEDIIKHLEEDSSVPYPNYYVARLWEDVIEIIPEVLVSLPDELVSRLNNYQNWQMWESRAKEWMLINDSDEADNLFFQATGWWDERRLYTSYLNQSPRIWFWRSGNTIHLQWNNQDLMRQGIPVWSSTQGEFTLPVEVFIQKIIAFDEQLMTEMSDKIAAVHTRWAIHDKDFDLEALKEDHKNRSTRLKHSLSNLNDKPTAWGAILRAIERIESHISFR